ncbi:MAG: DUF2339 domain-containing protein [Thermoplasmatota archaeon]
MAEGDRVTELEAKVRALEARLARLEGEAPQALPTPTAPLAPSWPAAFVPPARPPATPDVPRPPSPRPPAPHLRKPKRDWEALVGANWLARAGVLVLGLGVVFFLKLAYDNGWVPLWGRIAIGIVGGAAIFALADILRRKSYHAAFTQILAGGGAVISYVTIYVAYALPNYRAALHISLTTDIAALTLVAGALGAYAVWRNLPVLAGVAFGLTATLVAPVGNFSTAGLLFVTLLDCCLLAAAAWRRWDGVVLTGIVAVNAAHVAAILADVSWQLTAASALLVDSLAVAATARSVAPRRELSRLGAALATAALAFVLGAALTQAAFPKPFAWAFLAVGAAAVVACLAARRVAPALGGIGAGLLLAWPPLHFMPGLWTPVAYGGIAAAAVGAALAPWPAVRDARRYLRWGGAAAVGLGTVTLFDLALEYGVVASQPWASAAVALLLLALCLVLWITEAQLPEGRPAFGVAALLVGGWPFLQFPHHLAQPLSLWVLGSLAGLSALLWAPGRRLLGALAGATLFLAVLSLFREAAWEAEVTSNPWGAGILAAAVLVAAVALWASSLARPGQEASRLAGAACAALLVTAWPLLQFPFSLWATTTYAVVGLAFLGASMAWRPGRAWFQGVSSGCALFGVVTLLLVGSFSASSKVPMVTLCGGLLFLLGGGTWTMTRGREGERGTRVAAIVAACAGPAVALGLALQGWAIAVAWGFEALLVAGVGLTVRDGELRTASLALFAVVLARIFLFDLADLNLAGRVVAFMATGTLLLAGAFLYARQRRGNAPT